MDYLVTEKIKYPANKSLHTQDIAAFVQPSDAVKFAKQEADNRKKYDSETPFTYEVRNAKTGNVFNSYFNKIQL